MAVPRDSSILIEPVVTIRNHLHKHENQLCLEGSDSVCNPNAKFSPSQIDRPVDGAAGPPQTLTSNALQKRRSAKKKSGSAPRSHPRMSNLKHLKRNVEQRLKPFGRPSSSLGPGGGDRPHMGLPMMPLSSSLSVVIHIP